MRLEDFIKIPKAPKMPSVSLADASSVKSYVKRVAAIYDNAVEAALDRIEAAGLDNGSDIEDDVRGYILGGMVEDIVDSARSYQFLAIIRHAPPKAIVQAEAEGPSLRLRDVAWNILFYWITSISH